MKQHLRATAEAVMQTAMVTAELGPESAVRSLSMAIGRICARYDVPVDVAIEQIKLSVSESASLFTRSSS
jgi:hypothetical protein